MSILTLLHDSTNGRRFGKVDFVNDDRIEALKPFRLQLEDRLPCRDGNLRRVVLRTAQFVNVFFINAEFNQVFVRLIEKHN